MRAALNEKERFRFCCVRKKAMRHSHRNDSSFISLKHEQRDGEFADFTREAGELLEAQVRSVPKCCLFFIYLNTKFFSKSRGSSK